MDLSQTRDILVIKLSSVGDVVHSTAVVHHLRQLTGARIVWAIDEGIAPLLEGHPDIDDLLVFPRNPFLSFWRTLPELLPGLLRYIRELRRESFDVAIDLQGRGRSYLTLLLSKAPVKVGRGLFPFLPYRVLHRRNHRRHAIDSYFELTDVLGVSRPASPRLVLPPFPDDNARVQRTLHERGIEDPYVCLVPGTSWPSKCWPVGYWAKVAYWLTQNGFSVVLAGAAGESWMGEAILSQLLAPERIASFFGHFSLRELITLADRCSLVIAGDTGPLHIAVAAGTPVVALFGPTDPQRVGPLDSDRSRTLTASGCRMCQPYFRSWTSILPGCRRPCMQALQPALVIDAARELLEVWQHHRIESV
jgi:heptosyltransferase I